MKNETLTLKQLADELSISKSYIDKIIRSLSMHTQLKKEGNKYVLNRHQQLVIREYVQSKKTHTETDTRGRLEGDSEIQFLRSQLIARDQEIKNLHKILDQQQQLQLQTQKFLNNQQLVEIPNKDLKNGPSNLEEDLKQQEIESKQFKEELESKKMELKVLQEEIVELRRVAKKPFWKKLFSIL